LSLLTDQGKAQADATNPLLGQLSGLFQSNLGRDPFANPDVSQGFPSFFTGGNQGNTTPSGGSPQVRGGTVVDEALAGVQENGQRFRPVGRNQVLPDLNILPGPGGDGITPPLDGSGGDVMFGDLRDPIDLGGGNSLIFRPDGSFSFLDPNSNGIPPGQLPDEALQASIDFFNKQFQGDERLPPRGPDATAEDLATGGQGFDSGVAPPSGGRERTPLEEALIRRVTQGLGEEGGFSDDVFNRASSRILSPIRDRAAAGGRLGAGNLALEESEALTPLALEDARLRTQSNLSRNDQASQLVSQIFGRDIGTESFNNDLFFRNLQTQLGLEDRGRSIQQDPLRFALSFLSGQNPAQTFSSAGNLSAGIDSNRGNSGVFPGIGQLLPFLFL